MTAGQQLWIAFVLCTFGLIYSTRTTASYMRPVVNCFRSLYLWVDLQLTCTRWRQANSCELLSFFVPLGWFTAVWLRWNTSVWLWIAFVLCTFGLIYSRDNVAWEYGGVVNCFRSLYLWVDLQPNCPRVDSFVVVNCFRSLYLWVDLQLWPLTEKILISCELLSFFVPLGWFTAVMTRQKNSAELWIAFVLCTFGLIYSRLLYWRTKRRVVNCFRSLYLWVDLQHHLNWFAKKSVVNCFRSLYLWVDLQPWFRTDVLHHGCELLSFFVPLGWFTASLVQQSHAAELWIAFVLCTFGLIYSYTIFRAHGSLVVNCFRSLYLWVDLQRGSIGTIITTVVNCFRSLYLWVDLQRSISLVFVYLSCELLSFFVPLGWFTAQCQQKALAEKLWIAFVLCTFGLIYSCTGCKIRPS